MEPAKKKVVLVTGGAQGIGAACVRRFAAAGAVVVVADVADEAGEALADRLTAEGAEVVYRHADVSRRATWEELAALVRERWGRLDTIVSSAFTVRIAAAHELADADWDRQLAVNVKPLYLAAATLHELLRAARGSIVAVSSVHADFGFPGHPAYDASKGAVVALARQLAVDYAPRVRVNTVLPGPILTRTWDDVDAAGRADAAAQTLAGRMGDPDEVAGVVQFLAGPDASYVTGTTVTVDGGWGARK